TTRGSSRPGHLRHPRGVRLRRERDRADAGRGGRPVTAAFTRERDPAGVLVLTLDVPGEKVNMIGRGMLEEFQGLLAEAESDRTLKGVVVRSAKPDNFIGEPTSRSSSPSRAPSRARRCRARA